MTLTISAEPVPLQSDEQGTVRVAGTRLTLDSVLALYRQGQSVAEIADSFEGLRLADVHAILTYYLRHQTGVDAYLAARAEAASAVRRELEARQGPSPVLRRRATERAGAED